MGQRQLRRRYVLLPILGFAGLGGLLALGLTRDPTILPSTRLGKPAPAFTLPPLPGRDEVGFKTADLGGRPMLVNVFASWCGPCRVEHPLLTQLAADGTPVQGLAYKNRPEELRAWLAELGDPFTRIGLDQNGRVGLEWGVYGVPETFVIDKAGRVAHRHVGPLMPADLEKTIRPLLQRLDAA